MRNVLYIASLSIIPKRPETRTTPLLLRKRDVRIKRPGITRPSERYGYGYGHETGEDGVELDGQGRQHESHQGTRIYSEEATGDFQAQEQAKWVVRQRIRVCRSIMQGYEERYVQSGTDLSCFLLTRSLSLPLFDYVLLRKTSVE